MKEPVVKYIPPSEWDWLPPQAKTLQEAFDMSRKPPVRMTRDELERIYPKSPSGA
jgi:hypothetical protein